MRVILQRVKQQIPGPAEKAFSLSAKRNWSPKLKHASTLAFTNQSADTSLMFDPFLYPDLKSPLQNLLRENKFVSVCADKQNSARVY